MKILAKFLVLTPCVAMLALGCSTDSHQKGDSRAQEKLEKKEAKLEKKEEKIEKKEEAVKAKMNSTTTAPAPVKASDKPMPSTPDVKKVETSLTTPSPTNDI